MRGLVPKRQTFRKRSENVKQSELWPSVRGVTQYTEKSPFLSQYNNITDLFGGVVCFLRDTSTDDIQVQMSFLHHPPLPSGNDIVNYSADNAHQQKEKKNIRWLETFMKLRISQLYYSYI